MSKVVWHVVTSLDGFTAAPGDDMRWIFEVFGPSQTVEDVIAATGSIIMGRRTYEVEDRDRPGIYGGAWSGPFFVLTHHRPANVPPWMTGLFIHDGIEDAVSRARVASGGKNVGLLGATIARQCLDGIGEVDRLAVPSDAIAALANRADSGARPTAERSLVRHALRSRAMECAEARGFRP